MISTWSIDVSADYSIFVVFIDIRNNKINSFHRGNDNILSIMLLGR